MLFFGNQRKVDKRKLFRQIEALEVEQRVAVKLIRRHNGEFTEEERNVWAEYQDQIEQLKAAL